MMIVFAFTFSALMLLVGRQERHLAGKNSCFKTRWNGS